MKKLKRKIFNFLKRNEPSIWSVIAIALVMLVIICYNTRDVEAKEKYTPCKFGYHRVTKVSDGDSIVACAEDSCLKVRAACMDAPDRDTYSFSNEARIARQSDSMGITFKETTELAEVATEKARELLLNKCVKITPIGVDNYKRLVGYIEVGGKDYQLKMIKYGMAIPYCRYNCNKFSKIEKYKKVSRFKCIE